MSLSTQLRIILLLAGAAICLAIYLFGKRKSVQESLTMTGSELPLRETAPTFEPVVELDEEALDTPSYMRRHGQREARQDYEPRIADADDYADLDVPQFDQRFMDADRQSARTVSDMSVAAAQRNESVYAEPLYVEPAYAEPLTVDESLQDTMVDIATSAFEFRHELRISPEVDAETLPANQPVTTRQSPEFSEPAFNEQGVELKSMHATAEPPTLPSIPVVPERIEPALSELPVYVRAPAHTPEAKPPMPTLSDVVRKSEPKSEPIATPRMTPPSHTSTSPAAARPASSAAARRKIIALRIPMSERVPGTQLLSLLQSERLQHGKFSIFHRMQDAGTVFSVASMVEPGTFDPHTMAEQQFPGVTVFMLLPGPLDGLVAYDQMLSCAQRLAHATGGVLQDERGSKLTAQTMERLREEVLDFQHLIGGVASAR